MPRFFMAGSNIAGGVAFIGGSDAEHIRVLRLKVGDEIVICDGEGRDRLCRISRFSDGQVEAEILGEKSCPAEPSVKCSILAAYPKGERSDYIVQKCTESGAEEIVFFLSHRCVARPDERSLDKKIARFQRIAEEAAKQSGRGIIPKVSFVPDLAGAFNIAVKKQLPLFMYETGERVQLKKAIEDAGRIETAAIITGPEGGFESFEAGLAAAAGIKLCSMGPRILRCETAPVSALTALMYATDNM